MPWCVPITWDDPFAAQFSGSPFGGSTDATAAVIPAGGTTEDLIKFWNENNVPLGYTFSIQDGCICVDSDGVEPPTGIKVGFDPGDPTPTSGNHTASFSEIAKEDMPMDSEKEAFLDACLQTLLGCSIEELQEIFGTDPTKADIVAAVQGGISPPGGAEPASTSATIIGTFPSGFSPGDEIPSELGPVINPSCDPENGLVSLVIDLNIPATATGTAQTTFTVVDASAGWGTTYIVDKSTNTVLAQTYPPGAGGAGNTTPVPFDHSISFTIPPTGGEDICMVINAFGSAGSGPFAGTCDEIGPGETIITVTPDPCGPARACFEDMFGCTIGEMVLGDPDVQDALGILAEPPNIDVPNVKCGTVSADGEVTIGNLDVTKTGVGTYTINNVAALAASVTPHVTAGDDDVQPIVSIGVNSVKVDMLEQDNGAAAGNRRDEGFSAIIHCDDAAAEGPVRAEINVVGAELQIALTNDTAEAVAFDIKRDPGRDSTVTVAATKAQTQKYEIAEPTEVRVTALQRIVAQGTFDVAKKG